MVKVKVINEFIDRHTGQLHKVGEVFEVTEKRLKEIKSASRTKFVEVVKKAGDK